MKIFIVTDNVFWLNSLIEVFSKKKHQVSFFCSPKGKHIFEDEIERGIVKVINLKTNCEYLIANFELGFSFHCKQIFPREIVENVRCINVHPGFNPFNRGWFPQVFSILNKKPVGATIHLMDAEIDHGDVLFQRVVDVFSWDTSKDIYNRIIEAEYELFIDNIDSLIEGSYTGIKVNDEGNYNSICDYRRLQEIDLKKQTTMEEAIDFLRAMTHSPYKNAYYITDKKEKIFISLNIEKE